MPPNQPTKDIAELLGKLQKESNGMDEFAEHTPQNLQVDYVKCISCGKEGSEAEMQEVFYKQYKGICKMCFRFEIEE